MFWRCFRVKICRYTTDFAADNICRKNSTGSAAAHGYGEKILCTTTPRRDESEKK
jgi:hypothetical protein